MPELRQQLTLVLVTRDREVLLGLKKTGFGAGRWNALGGKIEPPDQVPYGKMWANDLHWLQPVLNGKCLTARFVFSDEETILSQEITETEFS